MTSVGGGMNNSDSNLIREFQALLGEYAWHSTTIDPSLEQVSDEHYDYVLSVLDGHDRRSTGQDMRVLEVASYAHTTGYRLQQELGCDVTLLDISAKTLQLGRQIAERAGMSVRPRLVAGDFHSLPFETGSFDLIYISSAVHHTWNYETVLSELQRVLAPGGLLLLLNEPCHRECCFYSFRTNRPAQFTKFERILYDLGVIRTLAEPYLGSRPETVFGMIENQMIPLRGLIAQLNVQTRISKMVLRPEDCMGELENLWLENRHKGREHLSNLIEFDLEERCATALRSFDDVAAGMGFQLPSHEQLRPFAQRIAQSLCRLPAVSDQEVFRIALSEIFGAAVQVTVEKPRGEARRRARVLRRDLETKDGIAYDFAPRIRRVLLHDCSLLPDIQLAPESKIANFFPAEHWHYTSKEDPHSKNIITLGLKSQGGRLLIPPCSQKVLIVLRYYCAVAEGCPVRIRIQHGHHLLYLQRVWQSESLLWVEMLPFAHEGIELCIAREVIGQSGECQTTAGGIAIAFAGAFPVD
jgi:SAM-dependent methyltransferase